MDIIPYGKQYITQQDIDAVSKALVSDYLTQGPYIAEFEREFANYVGSDYAVAVSNGTAALHLSALVLGLKEGDKVITTPISFAATANCIRYCGGEVIFSDINPDTLLIDFPSLKLLLDSSPLGTYKGIISVDFGGRAVDLEKLKNIAQEYDLWLIEDACHAPGGYFVDERNITQNCGNGKFADLSVFSFHPVKHIACGEGGMITTNSFSLYKKLLALRSHGISRNHDEYLNTIQFANGSDSDQDTYPEWYMEMQNLGYNYRITDIQAALGLSQLSRADSGLKRRKEIARKYNNAFDGKSFIIRQSGFIKGHAYHLYILEVKDRLGLYNYLRENNIFSQIHYIPIHLMPYYRNLGWSEGNMKFAEEYYKNCISLPMFPTLTEEQQQYVIDKICEYYA
ncbi:UDP-4-amino-4,6-dideoxy-N-acetyl-beta-L-altrosamine transaminase [Aquirufa lenticrescens]